MKRWVWRVFLAALVLAALTVGVFAAGANDEIWVDGFQLEPYAGGKEWIVVGYDGKEEEVVIPSLYENKAITAIKESAFEIPDTNPPSREKQLTKITIPGTVKTVGEKAFKNNKSLNTVTFFDYLNAKGDVERNATIGNSAFEGCSALENLTLSSNTLSIGPNAFKGCVRLPSVIIPKFVDTIGTGAFEGCTSLKKVTFLDGVTSFTGVFDNLQSMERIHCPKGSAVYSSISAALGKTKTARIVHEITDIKTEATSKASCQRAGEVQISFICPPKEVPDTDADGKPTTITTPCDTYSNGKYDVKRPTSMLPHTPEPIPDVDATCTQKGSTGGTRCSVCSTILEQPTETNTIPHEYNEDSIEDSGRVLFDGHCAKDSDGTPGLKLFTKKCAICRTYTPVCWKCQELEWKLLKARTELEAAQKAYDDAAAKLREAKKVWEETTAAQTRAQAAYDEATTTVGTADGKVKTAQEAFDNASDDKKAEAEKALDDAKNALMDAKIAQDDALTALNDAKKAVEKAAQDKTDAEDGLVSDNPAVKPDLEKKVDEAKAKVVTCEGELKDHAVLTSKKSHMECPECNEKRAAIDKATGSDKEVAITAYEGHYATDHSALKDDITSAIRTEDTAAGAHSWGVSYEVVTKQPICGSVDFSIKEVRRKCSVCGKEETLDTIKSKVPKDHTPDPNAKFTILEEATCTKDGKKGYEGDVSCVVCGEKLDTNKPVVIPALGHHWVDMPEEITKEPTCTENGEKTSGLRYCDRDNCPLKNGDKPYVDETNKKVEKLPLALGHKWGDFVPDPGQDATQAEDCREKTATGSAKCTRCGTASEKVTITIPGKLGHSWGEWVLSADGKTETRTCKVCGKKEERAATSKPDDDPCKNGHTWGEWILSADGKTETRVCTVCGKTETRPATTDPDTPDPDAAYTITVVQGAGGTIRVSQTSAKAGTSITVTITPDSGYELDMVRVIGSTTAEDLTGGRRSFIMPASNVKVQASFSRIASGAGWGGVLDDSSSTRTDPTRTQVTRPGQITPQSIPQAGTGSQIFLDIPVQHWAAGEIAWANEMGYMNGTNGLFNPDEEITMQQMWMALARMNGTYPASMAEARRWAAENRFADGSAPTGPVARHQLMTALYRCAYLRGAVSRSNASLAGYVDSRLVPGVARDAFIWGLSNGIITGDSATRLNPTGTVSRAQFAVFLYRYSQRV